MDLGAPACTGHRFGRFDEWTVRTEPGDELPDAAGSHQVIPEKLEAALQARGERRQIGSAVLMEEVDAQPRGKLALVAQREEGQMHRVVVFVRGAVGRRIRTLE